MSGFVISPFLSLKSNGDTAMVLVVFASRNDQNAGLFLLNYKMCFTICVVTIGEENKSHYFRIMG